MNRSPMHGIVYGVIISMVLWLILGYLFFKSPNETAEPLPQEPCTVEAITTQQHYKHTKKLVVDMENRNLTDKLLHEYAVPEQCNRYPITRCTDCHV